MVTGDVVVSRRMYRDSDGGTVFALDECLGWRPRQLASPEACGGDGAEMPFRKVSDTVSALTAGELSSKTAHRPPGAHWPHILYSRRGVDPRAQFALRADPPDAVRGRQKTALRCAGRHNSGPRACKSLQALGATPSDWQSLRVDYLRIGADQCNRIRRFRAMRVEGRYMLFGERLIELMGMTR